MVAACSLNFGQAWAFNPGGLTLALFLALQVALRPAVLLSARLRPAIHRISQFGSGAVLAFLLVVWIYRLHLQML